MTDTDTSLLHHHDTEASQQNSVSDSQTSDSNSSSAASATAASNSDNSSTTDVDTALPVCLMNAAAICERLVSISRGMWLIPGRLCVGIYPSQALSMPDMFRNARINMVVSLGEKPSLAQANEQKYCEKAGIAYIRNPLVTHPKPTQAAVFRITRVLAALLAEVPDSVLMLCDDTGSNACVMVAVSMVALHYHCTLDEAARYAGARFNVTHQHAKQVTRAPAQDKQLQCAHEVHAKMLQPRIETMFNRSTNPCRELLASALAKTWLVDGRPAVSYQKRNFNASSPSFNNNNNTTNSGSGGERKSYPAKRQHYQQ